MKFLYTLSAFATTVIGALLAFTGCKQEQADQSSKKKPNIIFIMADDLGWADVGYNGAEFHETPNIDKLASQGMILNQFYPSMATSAPSRASLLTGMYAPRHEVYMPQGLSRGGAQSNMRYKTPAWEADSSWYKTFLEQVSINRVEPHYKSLAEVLNKAGYTTARLGKWHIGGDNQGFDINSADGTIGETTNRTKTYQLTENISVKGGKEKRYYTDSTVARRLTDAALDFMENLQNQPFFLYLSHWEPHDPQVYPQQQVNYYKRKLQKYPDGEFNLTDPEYAAGVEQIDNSVGKVMQKLEALNLEENTIVIFTSDNGGIRMLASNNPLRAGKGSFYEGGIRAPFCIRWPGVIEPGTESNIPANGIDMMPTIAEVASAPLPEDQPVDGTSIVPIMKGKETDQLKNRNLYFHYPLYLGGGGEQRNILPVWQTQQRYWRAVPSSIVIQDKWKLIHYYEYDSTELFHLGKDISEQHNVAAEHPEIKNRLLNDLNNWVEEVKAPIPETTNENFTSGE